MLHLENLWICGAWVTQLDERLTLDFCSVHDLGVVELSPRADSSLSRESTWDSPSPSVLFPAVLMRSLSLFNNNNKKKVSL